MSSNPNEVYDENVQVVSKTKFLPYSYIPYGSYAHARAKHPNDTLYIYEGAAPAGFKIVAFPILMTKPVEETDGDRTE